MRLCERVEGFAGRLHEFIDRAVSRTRDFAGVHLIISPGAGVFSRSRRLRAHEEELEAAGTAGRPAGRGLVRRYTAGHPGHPADLMKLIADPVTSGRLGPGRHLIVSAGGDGTHREVLSALLGLPEELRGRFPVLRLPLGTGNDGADVRSLAQAGEILAGLAELVPVQALRIAPAGRKTLYAFNVASLGIDAFVTSLTNRLKGVLPGDSYRIIADAAVLFYDLLYGIRSMRLGCTGENGVQTRCEGRFILAAFGVSGRRSYGDHKRILPDDANVCAIANRSLLEKLRLKPLLYRGEHLGLPGVVSLGARELSVEYDGRIALQADGEAVWLDAENFPCRFEVFDTGMQALRLRSPDRPADRKAGSVRP